MTVTPSAPTTTLLRVWMNGQLYDDPAEARLAATDHGVVVGDGVFEALKVTPAGVFAVTRHLRRMTRSCRALGLPDPDHDLVRAGIEAVTGGEPYENGVVRVTYTGGLGPLGSQAPYGPPTMVVAAAPVDPPKPATSVVTVPWTRNENGALAGVKSTSYAENVRALAYAKERGGTEAIFRNTAGYVCEGTGSNIFFVIGGETITPPLTAGALAGITRELLLEWTQVTEADVTPAEAARADEVFLSSTIRDVQGVATWEDPDAPWQGTAPGPVTSSLARIFVDRAAEHIDP